MALLSRGGPAQAGLPFATLGRGGARRRRAQRLHRTFFKNDFDHISLTPNGTDITSMTRDEPALSGQHRQARMQQELPSEEPTSGEFLQFHGLLRPNFKNLPGPYE